MKKIISLILCVLLAVGAVAVLPVGAAESGLTEKSAKIGVPDNLDTDLSQTGVTNYNLWLGSTQVTDANKNNILNDGGKAKYDPVTQTLTLDNPAFNGSIRSSDINLTLKGCYQMKTAADTPDIALYVTGGNLTLDGDFLLLGLRYGILASKDVTINSGTLDVQEGLVNDFKDNNVAAFFGLKAGGILRIKDDVDCVSAFAASNSWGAPIGAYFMEVSDQLEITDPAEGYIDSLVLKMNDYNIFTGYTVYDKHRDIPSHVTIKKPGFQWAYDLWLGGKRVTGVNQDDILGDGKASFDPSTLTLTLNEPDLSNRSDAASKISAQNMSLTVKGAYHTDSSSSRFGINVENGDLALQGDFLFTGATDAVKITGGTLKVINGNLIATGGSRGISARTINIGLRADRVEAKGTDKAISASFLTVNESLHLLTPQGGSINGAEVYDSNNAVAKHVVFGRGFTVSFDANGGDGAMNSVTVEKNSAYILPECAFTHPDGKAFKSWTIGRNSYSPGDTVTISANTTVTAKWVEPEKITSIDLHGETAAITGQFSTTNPPAGYTDDPAYKIRIKGWMYYTRYNGRYRWIGFDGFFEEGVEYMAEYVIEPNPGYVFSEYVYVFSDDNTFVTFSPDSRDGYLHVTKKVTAKNGSRILGDVDGDSEVTIIDATAIQRNLASLPTQAFNATAADTDKDGKVTILDATAIQRHLASLPTQAEGIGKPIA